MLNTYTFTAERDRDQPGIGNFGAEISYLCLAAFRCAPTAEKLQKNRWDTNYALVSNRAGRIWDDDRPARPGLSGGEHRSRAHAQVRIARIVTGRVARRA